MIPNHTIDVEAERRSFEAATPGFMHLTWPTSGKYRSQVVEDHWQGWLAAKRSTPAVNAGTIDAPAFAMEAPDGIAEEALSRDEFALYSAMSDISEELWFAGWMGGLEFTLWAALQGDSLEGVDRNALANVAALSVKTGKWMVWRSGQDLPVESHGPYAIPLAEWTSIYDAWNRRTPVSGEVTNPAAAPAPTVRALMPMYGDEPRENWLGGLMPEQAPAPTDAGIPISDERVKFCAWNKGIYGGMYADVAWAAWQARGQQQAGVPDGYLVVPKVMTDAMRDAGNEIILNRCALVRAYAAMIAAAPSVPGEA